MTKKQFVRVERIKKELADIQDGLHDLSSNESELDRTMYLAWQLVELLEGD